MRRLPLWIGKLIYVILRLLGKRGAALPGLVVEKISPGFLADSLKQLPNGVVVVTGTNGKTTSTKMLTHVLCSKMKVLTNPTGSNFTRGVIASIVQNSTWLGKLDYDIAVIELDEAYAAKFSESYSPEYCLVLNVMRDQMDRFGEIDYTAKLISKVVEKTTKNIILNADDRRVSAMTTDTGASIEYFGVSPKLRDLYRNDDELHGGISDIKKHKLLAEMVSFNDRLLNIKLNGNIVSIPFNIEGTYNAQNAVAVIAMAFRLGISVEDITTCIETAKPAFGRGEVFIVNGKRLVLQLVKNPGGFRHSLLGGSKMGAKTTIIAINDDYADGRDVSWLWDVKFQGFMSGDIYTSGTRASDMALRLGYDDIGVKHIASDLSEAVRQAIDGINPGETLLVYATYTAMLEIRKIIAKMTRVDKI